MVVRAVCKGQTLVSLRLDESVCQECDDEYTIRFDSIYRFQSMFHQMMHVLEFHHLKSFVGERTEVTKHTPFSPSLFATVMSCLLCHH